MRAPNTMSVLSISSEFLYCTFFKKFISLINPVILTEYCPFSPNTKVLHTRFGTKHEKAVDRHFQRVTVIAIVRAIGKDNRKITRKRLEFRLYLFSRQNVHNLFNMNSFFFSFFFFVES